jgi:Flp pilus assembly protein TadG
MWNLESGVKNMKVKTETFLATLKDEKGQNLIEFALVVPLLLVLVFGIAEYGRAWMTRNILTGAAREAVRVAAVSDAGIAAGITRANVVLASAGINSASVSVTPAAGPFEAVTATISYQFPLVLVGFIPGLNSPTITLTTTTTMRREY